MMQTASNSPVIWKFFL